MEHIKLWLFGASVVVLLGLALFAIMVSRRKVVFKARGQLLLLNEQRFLMALKQAVPPNIMISVKVRMLDIVASSGSGGKAFDRKLADRVADFVLINPDTTNVLLCIEMDARSKTMAERMSQNTYSERALRRAGIPFLRLPLVRYYDADKLRIVIQTALQGALHGVKK